MDLSIRENPDGSALVTPAVMDDREWEGFLPGKKRIMGMRTVYLHEGEMGEARAPEGLLSRLARRWL